MKSITYLLAALLVLLTSCSGNDYLNAIPGGSTALLSIDVQQFPLLRSVHGIDVSNKVYLFESPDGNLGLCAPVSSENEVEKWLNELASKGVCQPTETYKGYHFTLYKDSWVVGVSNHALLMMGPVVGEAQLTMRQQIAKYLSQDEEMGIKGTPMFDKLDSIGSRMAMVAQARALPEQLVAPFMLGAPKEADASQIVIGAKMSVADGILFIHGETFSFNKRINASLKEAQRTYRPIQGDYERMVARQAPLSMLMNVNGNDFLPILHQNKSLQALLAGINTAIDMDNIIRAVDGDMVITVNSLSEDGLSMAMGARLSNSDFLNDVDYWKQSCPSGSRIVDWRHPGMTLSSHKAYKLENGSRGFYFGVLPGEQPLFYSGSDESTALYLLNQDSQPAPKLPFKVSGERMMMVISLSGLTGDKQETAGIVTGMLKPLFGDITSIVYTLE